MTVFIVRILLKEGICIILPIELGKLNLKRQQSTSIKFLREDKCCPIFTAYLYDTVSSAQRVRHLINLRNKINGDIFSTPRSNIPFCV